MRAPAALLAAGDLRTGCTGDDVGLPGPAKVDVDTPELREMKQGAARRPGRVLGIDHQDPQVNGAMELVADTGVTYPLLADPQASLSAQDPFPPLQGRPYLALDDADGRVAWGRFIVLESRGELEDLVREHLGAACEP